MDLRAVKGSAAWLIFTHSTLSWALCYGCGQYMDEQLGLTLSFPVELLNVENFQRIEHFRGVLFSFSFR